MHRFYMFHSFTKFHRNAIAPACLFLAAKVEEQPRKLEHVVGVAHRCLNRDAPAMTPDSEKYLEKAQELVIDENILLQTLGFDITVDHPHTHVVKTCQLVRASKDLAQTSYFLATNSLHLSTMCLTVKPTVVACVAIHLACKWSSWELPRSNEGKDWWWYVEKGVTKELLEELTADFLNIIERCPTRLKGKIMTWKSGKREDLGDAALDQFKDRNSPVPSNKPSPRPDAKPSPHPSYKPSPHPPHKPSPLVDKPKPHSPTHEPEKQSFSYKEYKERKEKEKAALQSQLKKSNGASEIRPDKASHPGPSGSRPESGPTWPEHRHRKLTAEQRPDKSRPEIPGQERPRPPDPSVKPRPGEVRKSEQRPDARPDLKHRSDHNRPRVDDRHRQDPNRPRSDRPGERPRTERPPEHRDVKPAHKERPKQEEGLRVRSHPKPPVLDNLKPLLPVKTEQKEKPKAKPEPPKPEFSQSLLDDLFGDTGSPMVDDIMDPILALERDLKAAGADPTIAFTPDYGVDSNILELMATPPARGWDKPDFDKAKVKKEDAKDEWREKEERERKEREEKERKDREERERKDKEDRERKENEERLRKEKEERDRKEREEKERKDREERERRKREASREKRYSMEAPRAKVERKDQSLTEDERKRLEEEPSPYKKEKLYPPRDRKPGSEHKPGSLSDRFLSKDIKPISKDVKTEQSWSLSSLSRMTETADKTNKSDVRASSSSQPERSQPSLYLPEVSESLSLSQPEQPTQPSIKVKLPKLPSKLLPEHSSPKEEGEIDESPPAPTSLKMKINAASGTVEPLKLKISLGHHKEKKKHRKDGEERHKHKHKSKKSHDHDKEHKSRKRAHSPSEGGSEHKVRRQSESGGHHNGGSLLSPNMQPVVELPKLSDAQIRRSSTSKSPISSSRPHQQ